MMDMGLPALDAAVPGLDGSGLLFFGGEFGHAPNLRPVTVCASLVIGLLQFPCLWRGADRSIITSVTTKPRKQSRCEMCGKRFELHPQAKRRLTCSPRCRTRKHRLRKAPV